MAGNPPTLQRIATVEQADRFGFALADVTDVVKAGSDASRWDAVPVHVHLSLFMQVPLQQRGDG